MKPKNNKYAAEGKFAIPLKLMWGSLNPIEIKVDKDAEIKNSINQDRFPQILTSKA
jgi:hypothetical protein